MYRGTARLWEKNVWAKVVANGLFCWIGLNCAQQRIEVEREGANACSIKTVVKSITMTFRMCGCVRATKMFYSRLKILNFVTSTYCKQLFSAREIMKCSFFKMGHYRPLFCLFSSFQQNNTIFPTNKCEKMSI